jgi:hypothetical protein
VNYSAEACSHCVKVWNLVVLLLKRELDSLKRELDSLKRELDSLPECLRW